MLLAGVLVNCGRKADRQVGVTPAESDGPLYISIMTRQTTGEIPSPDNQVIREIEKVTNTDLDIDYVPNIAYREKLSVTVASNDYPMMTLMDTDGKPLTIEVDTVRAGVWWRIGDYLKDYKYLSQLDDARIKNASIDGHLWGLFRYRPSIRDGLYYRKDWAEKLGFTEKPRNPEELYAIIEAFVKKDPDGNGRADTYGVAQMSSVSQAISVLAPYYGLGNGYEMVNGKLQPIFDKSGYLELIKFLKRLYDDGLMNKDFPTVTNEKRNEMMADNYGCALMSIDQGWFSIVPLQKVHPEATFTVMVDFADNKAPIWGRAGFNGKWYVAKQAVPDEKTFHKVMEFMNWLYSPEVNNLIYCGIEDRHYTKVGPDTITINDEQRRLYGTEVQVMEQIGSRYQKETYKIQNNTEYEDQLQYFYYDYNVPTVGDPTWPLASEIYNERGSDLNQIVSDANIKFVTGAISENGWKAEIERWHRSGGDQMIAEYQKDYDEHQQ
jgi:putative aldouronate transport system substrate-binding protein